MRTSSLMCLLLLTLTLTACASAPGTQTSRVQGTVEEFGVIASETQPTARANPETPQGHEIYIEQPSITRQTKVIEARVGTTFGFRFTVSGLEPGTNVTLRKVVKYPPMRLPDGTTSQGYTTNIGPTPVDGEGRIGFVEGYTLESEYELVTGRWTMEIWYGSQKLVSQDFDVVAPGTQPSSSRRCSIKATVRANAPTGRS